MPCGTKTKAGRLLRLLLLRLRPMPADPGARQAGELLPLLAIGESRRRRAGAEKHGGTAAEEIKPGKDGTVTVRLALRPTETR